MQEQELVNQLEQHGIRLCLTNGTLRATRPPGCTTWDELTPAASALMEQLKQHKEAVIRYLRALELARTIQGRQLKIYPMRRACIEANYCKQFTTEADCELYPIMDWEQGEPAGWCRERV